MQIFNIQWKQHGKSFTKELKLPASFSTLLAQIETPLQFASIVICPQCEQHVAEIQNAIKTNENVPKWAVELGVPAAVCPLFYAVDPDLVPICMVGGFGLNMFLANSDSASVCALLPFCSSISGRPHNAVSDSDSSFASAFSGKSSETGTGADTTTLVITTSTTEAPETDIFKDVLNYFKPALLDSKVMEEIGVALMENEWEPHKNAFENVLPMTEALMRPIFLLTIPFESPVEDVIPECNKYVVTIQKFLSRYPGVQLLVSE
ncbi:unnamed protein product [Bursaphelenchus okinawaensis]|uniref:Uncharacterized protein n=1 Tax=Bursaphelenchus okinawaensis TaxID=465554 RepID=A0A811KKA7_9BILA|nr:unnamed protein product [Bursaphelenchus okinawaensis]CAG9106379.1 unnamed protein product [Bursaphelenchus okinawaensis]